MESPARERLCNENIDGGAGSAESLYLPPASAKTAGVTTVDDGETEGRECVGKNRVTPYTARSAGIDGYRRLGILRSRHIDSTLAAIDCGIGKLGCAIFSLEMLQRRARRRCASATTG